MDRNLGALSVKIEDNSDGGLFYQFGRKDPIPYDNNKAYNILGAKIGNGYRTVSMNENITMSYYVQRPNDIVSYQTGKIYFENPYMMEIWDNPHWHNITAGHLSDKSFFDPCPQGWKVPQNGVWTGIVTEVNSDAFLKGSSYYLSGMKITGGEAAWYPRTGFRVGEHNYDGGRTAYRSSTPATVSEAYVLNMLRYGNSPRPEYHSTTGGWHEMSRSAYDPVRCVQEK